jgi:hypothetical protein
MKETAMTTRDDAFDENGLLRDGHSSRVRMTMRDSADERVTIVDALGCGGFALHRPGARYAAQAGATDAGAGSTAADADPKDPRIEAYQQHDNAEARRWQGDGREVPVRQSTGDARQDAYLDRDESDANAWRNPTPTPGGI